MQRRRLRPAVRCADLDKEIVGIDLRVFEGDIEVTMVSQNSRVPQLGFRRLLWPPKICRDQLLVRKAPLRITVEHPHIAMSWRAVFVEINFLHVFAVVSLRPGHTEKPLFQERIAPIPERERETEAL